MGDGKIVAIQRTEQGAPVQDHPEDGGAAQRACRRRRSLVPVLPSQPWHSFKCPFETQWENNAYEISCILVCTPALLRYNNKLPAVGEKGVRGSAGAAQLHTKRRHQGCEFSGQKSPSCWRCMCRSVH